jgi:hypothetical protein
MSAIFTETRESGGFTTASDDAGPACHAGADWQARWIVIFMAVGVTARLLRYLLRFPLWGDEAMLSMNLMDRDYAGLMRPLDCHQVAPLLFLWTERTAVKLLGFNEWALRLFPLLCGIASLYFFQRLARLLLRGNALVLAVGIFAVAYSGLRYASETKPYAVDQLVSTIVIWMAVQWWRQPGDTRWLWALTAFTPLALGVSYPAVFVVGGTSLTVAMLLLKASSPRGWRAWVALNLALAGSFLVWFKLAVEGQSGAELNIMGRMWEETFPPHGSLSGLLWWLLRVHAGPLLAVPIGGDHWGSAGTALLCIVAAAVLIRRGRYRMLLLCAAPFALNLLAAAMHRYPYGGHMRLAMHLAPLIAILAGIGLAETLSFFTRNRPSSFDIRPSSFSATWPVRAAAGLLVLLAIASTARDFVLPGKEQQEIRRRDFAVWFWGSMEREHEVVSISGDLKRFFTPPGFVWHNCISPQFLCNARIYSPRQSRGIPCDLGRVSRDRSLLCVQYWSHSSPYDLIAFNHWLDEMRERFDLIAMRNYPMTQDNDYDAVKEPLDRVEVYEFVPRAEKRSAQPASGGRG